MCKFKINDKKDLFNKNFVKVVCDIENNALYFSIFSIPGRNEKFDNI